jgi:hypothetical protein
VARARHRRLESRHPPARKAGERGEIDQDPLEPASKPRRTSNHEGPSRWPMRIAGLVTAVSIFAVTIIGAILAIWDNGYRTDSPSIFMAPVVPGAYNLSVGTQLSVNVVDDIGLAQKLGVSRQPVIQIRMSIYIDPATKSLDHSWKIELPQNSTFVQTAERLSQTAPGHFHWEESDSKWIPVKNSEITFTPPTFSMTNAAGDEVGDSLVIVMVNIRVPTLSVGHVIEDGRPAELWHLAWAPGDQEGLGNIYGTPDGTLKGVNPKDPFSKSGPVTTNGSSYQLTACPSCFAMYSYQGATEVDKSEWAVAGNFGEAKTLSFSTPAYPWNWLSGFYLWIVGIMAAALVMFWTRWLVTIGPLGEWVKQQRKRFGD